MGIMRAEQEQHDRDGQKKLLCRCVLISVIDLLPHVQVVVGSSVELEWHASDVMEHEVGASHVDDVGQCPGDLLGHAWNDVTEDLEGDDEHWVYRPGTCKTVSTHCAHALLLADAPFELTHCELRLGRAD